MNTNALIGLAALIVVVGSGVFLFGSKGNTSTPMGTAGAEVSAEGTSSFEAFLARGGSWMCTISVANEEAPTQGTAFISGEKMRGDFISTPVALGREVESHMIRTDGFFYTWSNLTPQGMKVAIPAPNTDASAAGNVVNLTQEVTYSCAPWVEDGSVFDIPSDISFMDVSAGLPTTQPY